MRLADDFRYAVRELSKRRGFALTAIVILALGIGPNVAIFSAVHALLIKPLPFPDPDRLVWLDAVHGGEPASLSYREIRDFQALDEIFEDVAGYTDQGQYNASGFGSPEELVSTITTQNLFSVLGVELLLGQPWPEELDRARDFKLVISHELWQRRFGGNHDVLGRTLTLDGAEGYEILGVLPRGFAFPVRSDLYRSSGINPDPLSYEDRSSRGRWGVGRLREGVTLAQARSALDRLAEHLEREFPGSNSGIGYRVTPLRDLYVGDARAYLLLVMGAMGLVLLIACSNVANLLFSRIADREREVAVRMTLGAPRAAILRLLVVEGITLALAAGALGVLLAGLGLELLVSLIRLDFPVWLSIDLSLEALLFTVMVSIVAGLVTGLIPAWRMGRGDLAGLLKEGGRSGTAGVGQQRLRSALVAGQVAFAVMLLIGAGLLVRSFSALANTSPGFDPDSLLTFRVELGWRAYPDVATTSRFRREMLEGLAALPGVEVAAVTDNLPLAGQPKTDTAVMLEGQSLDDPRRNPFLNLRVVSPAFFEALRIPLLRGRLFDATDRENAPTVVLVSEAVAGRLWPGEDPVGARIRTGDGAVHPEARWRTVVGVVGNVRHEALGAPASLDVYMPFDQFLSNGNYFVLRTHGDPLALSRHAPELTWSVDPDQSFFDVRTMRERIGDRVWIPRLASLLTSAFSALASILAALGISASLAYSVAQRTRELGLRQALGASRAHLYRRIIGEGMRLVLAGGVIGFAAALLLAGWLHHLFYGIDVLDAPTLLAVPAVLIPMATIACWVPARRAVRISPTEALRSER